jgi:hypothetical protein
MTEREYLMIVYIEELSELIKELSKCVRFTPEHRYALYSENNWNRASVEWNQVIAMEEMLQERGLSFKPDRAVMEKKKQQTLELMEFSKEIGVVKNE